MDLMQIRSKLDQKKGEASQIKKDLKNAQDACDKIQQQIKDSEDAQKIIQAVASQTQRELEYRITEPVSLALASVYDDPYKMSARFEITGKGNTECYLGFERDGHVIERPAEKGGKTGGGPIDVASFALRIGSWSLQNPRSRPVLILDEPFKWIDKEKVNNSDRVTMHLAGQMLRQMTKPPPDGLGLQIIMISHIKELIEAADRIIKVNIKGRESFVEWHDKN